MCTLWDICVWEVGAAFDDKIISDADARFGKEKREKINLSQGFTIRTVMGRQKMLSSPASPCVQTESSILTCHRHMLQDARPSRYVWIRQNWRLVSHWAGKLEARGGREEGLALIWIDIQGNGTQSSAGMDTILPSHRALTAGREGTYGGPC